MQPVTINGKTYIGQFRIGNQATLEFILGQ